jgi:hypothetical protein
MGNQRNSSGIYKQGNKNKDVNSLLTTAGDIVISNSRNQITRLPVGQEDYQLVISGGAPAWKAGFGEIMKVGYWSYPGSTAWNATWGENGVEFNQTNLTKYNHSYKIFAEFLTVDTGATATGFIQEITTAQGGYTTGNVTTYKNNCQELFATCSSANNADMELIMNDLNGLGVSAINTMTTFVQDNTLSGIDLNWEDFSSWSVGFGTTFAGWLGDLKTSLNNIGASLNLDLPYIGNATIASAYNFDYSTFIDNVDYLTIAMYDIHFDWGYGMGICPIEALVGGSYHDNDMTLGVTEEQGKTTFFENGTLGKFASDNSNNNMDKLIIGLPAYGFAHTNGAGVYSFTNNLTKNKINFNSSYDTNTLFGQRDTSGELRWNSSGHTMVFCDGSSMRRRTEICRQWLKKWELDNPSKTKPIYEVMFWHMGGNNDSYYQ